MQNDIIGQASSAPSGSKNGTALLKAQTAAKAKNQNNTGEETAAKTNTADQVIDKNALEAAIDKINKSLDRSNIKSEFVKDEDLGRMIVKFINRDTEEVIRQYPSEVALTIAKNIDTMLGMILDDKI